jgi:Fe(3+) dicitrate transport protein
MKSIVLALMLFPISLFAQSIESLEAIDVTADQEAYRPSWIEQDKTKILSGKKNRTTKVDYLPPVQTDNHRQFFSQQASIHAADIAADPWTSLSFRGIGDPHEAQNILILQDGIPVSLDMYSSPNVYYAPPAQLMEEISVIAGGGALMYGPQPGGAINYISPRLTKHMPNSGSVNLAAGSYNLLSTVNSIKGSSGNTSYWGGYYRKQGDGYMRKNGDFTADHLQLKTHTYLESNTIFKTSIQGYDSDYGVPGGQSFSGVANGNEWDGDNRKATRKYDSLKISRALLQFGVEKKISSATTLDTSLWGVAYRRYSQNQTGLNNGVPSTTNTNVINDIHSYGVNAEARLSHNWQMKDQQNTLSVGVLTYNSDSPTHAMAGAAADSHSGSTTSRNARKTRTNSVFLENRFSFGDLTLVPGLRYENIIMSNHTRTSTSATADGLKRNEVYNVLLGGLGSSYSINDNLQAFANISQGFKPINYNDVIAQANPLVTVNGDIKPSYNYFYEAGLRGETPKLNWDTSAFVIHRQNIVSTSGTVVSNGSSVRYHGLEASTTLKDVLNSKNVHELDIYANGIYNQAEFRRGSLKGETPGYVPAIILKYGLVYRQQDKLKVSFMGNWVREHYADDAHSSNRKIPSYSVYDLLGEYGVTKSFSVNGAINNILHNEYYTRVNATGILPAMGRNYYAGVTYRF